LSIEAIACRLPEVCSWKIEAKRGLQANGAGFSDAEFLARARLGWLRLQVHLTIQSPSGLPLLSTFPLLFKFDMSSTGGGWAQLRQQARGLETQVRNTSNAELVGAVYPWMMLTKDADRIALPHVFSTCIDDKHTN
jgi:hypothetical protein